LLLQQEERKNIYNLKIEILIFYSLEKKIGVMSLLEKLIFDEFSSFEILKSLMKNENKH